MRKYIFLSFLLFFLLIPINVSALTFEKCGQQVEVDDTNFIYYLYQNYTSYFNTYDYYYYYLTHTYNEPRLYFSNYNDFYSTGVGNPDLRKNYFYYKDCLQFRFNSDFSFSSIENYLNNSSHPTIYSAVNFNFNTFITNADMFRVSPYNGSKYYFKDLTSKQDLIDYFNNCPVVADYQTKNRVFTNFILDFVCLLPYIIVFILIFEGVGWLINKKTT